MSLLMLIHIRDNSDILHLLLYTDSYHKLNKSDLNNLSIGSFTSF